LAKKKKEQTEVDTPSTEIPYTLNPELMRDAQGRYRTKSLFEEYSIEGYPSIFSLKDYHRPGAPSFKLLYVALGDPTEYDTALRLVGSWAHWQKLVECPWIQETLCQARDELTMKLKSEAVARITKDSKEAFSEATRLAANKFLATEGYASGRTAPAGAEADEAPKRGRPSKEEVSRHMAEEVKKQDKINNDYDRVVNLGGKASEG
jgi:hypothetical protein